MDVLSVGTAGQTVEPGRRHSGNPEGTLGALRAKSIGPMSPIH